MLELTLTSEFSPISIVMSLGFATFISRIPIVAVSSTTISQSAPPSAVLRIDYLPVLCLNGARILKSTL